MSKLNNDSERASFRKRVVRRLSAYGTVLSRVSRSSSRRREQPSAIPADFPSDWELSPTHEGPAFMLSESMEASSPPLDFAKVTPDEWHPHYAACVQHFVHHSQHSHFVQSVAAYLNIRLPCQRSSGPVSSSHSQHSAADSAASASASLSGISSFVSLRPYIRRLIVTGQDSPSVLHAFFGDDWVAGIGPIREQERVNYLFTAKSSGWAATKAAYDILPDELAPFLRPLREPSEEEIRAAEARWSEWLAMEDWMVGPRSPW